MFNKINHIFDFNQKALNFYAKRQEILSSNIANADTPGYQAIDINFNDELQKMLNKNPSSKNIHLNTTYPNHLNARYKNTYLFNIKPIFTNQVKQDGNTVNMDQERIKFIENSLQYESSLIFLKNEIKNIIHVIKG